MRYLCGFNFNLCGVSFDFWVDSLGLAIAKCMYNSIIFKIESTIHWKGKGVHHKLYVK